MKDDAELAKYFFSSTVQWGCSIILRHNEIMQSISGTHGITRQKKCMIMQIELDFFFISRDDGYSYSNALLLLVL